MHYVKHNETTLSCTQYVQQTLPPDQLCQPAQVAEGMQSNAGQETIHRRHACSLAACHQQDCNAIPGDSSIAKVVFELHAGQVGQHAAQVSCQGLLGCRHKERMA